MTLINILDNDFLSIDDLPEDAERAHFCAYIKDEEAYLMNMNERCNTRVCDNILEL